MAMVVGCREQHNGAVVADIEQRLWQEGQSVELHYLNADTLGSYDLWVVARTEQAVANSPLHIGVECMSPDSAVVAGEVVLVPRAAKGGSFCGARTLWVERARLSQLGHYSLRLKNVGTEAVEGVWTVGVDFVEREN